MTDNFPEGWPSRLTDDGEPPTQDSEERRWSRGEIALLATLSGLALAGAGLLGYELSQPHHNMNSGHSRGDGAVVVIVAAAAGAAARRRRR